MFRKVNRGGRVDKARLVQDAVRQFLLKRARKAGLRGALAEPFSPHGLGAGFVTTAYRNGVPKEDHGSHKALQPDDDAELRPPGQAQPGEPSGQAGSLV